VRNVSALKKAAEHITTGELAQAQSLLSTILRENAKDPDGLHLMGLVGLKAGKFQAAASLIESAISLRPVDPRLYSNCGEAYRRSGNMDLAFQRLQRALELDSQNAGAWCNYGSLCRELGQTEEAIAAYRKAIALDGKHANAHYNLGLALWSAAISLKVGRSTNIDGKLCPICRNANTPNPAGMDKIWRDARSLFLSNRDWEIFCNLFDISQYS
jgi:Flp pilus assembly protein TadD